MVSDMIDLKCLQSVENIPLRFARIKRPLTERGQHKHVLFFSAWEYFQALLGFLGFMITWE